MSKADTHIEAQPIDKFKVFHPSQSMQKVHVGYILPSQSLDTELTKLNLTPDNRYSHQ